MCLFTGCTTSPVLNIELCTSSVNFIISPTQKPLHCTAHIITQIFTHSLRSTSPFVYGNHTAIGNGSAVTVPDLSLHLMAILPGPPVSILHFVEAKDDGSGSDNWRCKTHKAPVKSSPPTNHITQLFTGQMSILSPNQQHHSTERNV